MVVFTAKLTKSKVITWVIVLGIVVCSGIVLARNVGDRGTKPEDGQQTLQVEQKGMKTNADRIALLQSLGWQVDEDPLEFMEVRIPDEFDGVYSEYNNIQTKQGMDLSKYKGKRAMRYTYKINNYPNNENGVVANMIIYKNKLIAADVCSPKLGGFMHGLSPDSANNETAPPQAGEQPKTENAPAAK